MRRHVENSQITFGLLAALKRDPVSSTLSTFSSVLQCSTSKTDFLLGLRKNTAPSNALRIKPEKTFTTCNYQGKLLCLLPTACHFLKLWYRR